MGFKLNRQGKEDTMRKNSSNVITDGIPQSGGSRKEVCPDKEWPTSNEKSSIIKREEKSNEEKQSSSSITNPKE